MRVAVAYRTSSKEAYKKFCSAHPEVKLDFEKWKEIIYSYNYLFRDYLLETGDRVKLPWGLGSFSINKKKVRKTIIKDDKELVVMPVDWQKSRKAGKKIYHLNSHTDGYRYKWLWFAGDARIYQCSIWVFKPSRITSRKLAQYIKKPGANYFQIYKQWK